MFCGFLRFRMLWCPSGVRSFHCGLIPANTIHHVTTSNQAFDFHTSCIITMTLSAV
jgi:hypothetical protein